MTLVAARRVADAVLYEGYLLYPYRASSSKNQVRWQFGILGPRGAVAAGVGEESTLASEIVVEPTGGDAAAELDLTLRFLQVQSRVVERRTADGWLPVDDLLVGATRWIPFHEAVSREVPLRGLAVDRERSLDVMVPAGQDVEELVEDGVVVGRLVRSRWTLRATVTLTPRPAVDARLAIARIEVRNESAWDGAVDPGWNPRDVAARSSFVGTHLLLTARHGRFVSLLDGPDWAQLDALSCRQERCWPVLVAADEGNRDDDAILVSPIILGDYPSIAPESAGDLFDATEIDEILTLRVMTMTEDEKADARGTDPRAAAILARCDAMTTQGMDRLHGGRRDEPTDSPAAFPGHGYGDDDVPWWDAGQDAMAQPETDSVVVAGKRVAKGSRVMLRPSRRADVQDIFLAGMTATVTRVYFDVDGNTHVAVVLEDDPAGDLYGSTGRFYYFGPEEIEPLAAREEAR